MNRINFVRFILFLALVAIVLTTGIRKSAAQEGLPPTLCFETVPHSCSEFVSDSNIDCAESTCAVLGYSYVCDPVVEKTVVPLPEIVKKAEAGGSPGLMSTANDVDKNCHYLVLCRCSMGKSCARDASSNGWGGPVPQTVASGMACPN